MQDGGFLCRLCLLRTGMKDNRPPICDYEGSNYQTRFWEEGEREYEHQVEQIALRRLLPPGGNRLLELGAGAGRNTPRYAGFDQVVLLDYSLSQLQKAQENLGQHERYLYVAGDVYRLPFLPGVFDCATMIRTLHHMADAPAALAQIRRVVSDQGVFILEFANKRNLKAIGRYLMGLQDWNPFSLQPVEFVELNFDFHPRAIREWLRDLDFEIDRQLTVSHFRLNLLKRLIPTSLLVRLDAAAQLTGNWWQLTPSVFVRSTASGGKAGSNRDPEDRVAIFQCPQCAATPLQKRGDQLLCPSCGNNYPIRDGIYDFRDNTEPGEK